jgi:hypothetical protein
MYAVAGSTLAILIGTSAVAVAYPGVTKTPNKSIPANPEAGLSDAQRLALHAEAHRRNDEYLREFVAQHRDPRSLPHVRVQSFGAPLPTLSGAVRKAEVILHGDVQEVTFASSLSGGMPVANATVRVRRVVKGHASGSVTVLQLGGPVAQGQGGGLAELDTDELILPGDEVILLLKQEASDRPYRTILGAGVFFVRGERVRAEDSNPFKEDLNGKTVDSVLNVLQASAQ